MSFAGRAVRVRPLVWLLALLLLQVQLLGLWHAVDHAVDHAGRVGGLSARHDAEALSYGHASDDEASCRLFDQLATALALASAPLAWVPETASTLIEPSAPVGAPGRALRPYQARAPPRG